jgi:hypothetical protein
MMFHNTYQLDSEDISNHDMIEADDNCTGDTTWVDFFNFDYGEKEYFNEILKQIYKPL